MAALDLLEFLLPGTKSRGRAVQTALQEKDYKTALNKAFNPLESGENARSAAGVASYAVPFGKGANFLTKFLAPGAGVGALQSLAESKNPLSGAVGGAATAGALGGILSLGGKAIKSTSKALSSVGENLAVKSLRPSPSQQRTFLQETGEKMGEFLKKRGMQGVDYEELVKKIEPFQQAFDEVVGSKKLKIDTKDVLSGLQKQAEKLSKSVIPQERSKAQALQGISDNFREVLGEGPVSAERLTALRKEIDKNIRDFAMDPATKGPLQHTRDAIQEAIRSAANKKGIKVNGQPLKDVGVELSKLYKLLDVAEKQQFLGGGTGPLNLRSLLGAGVGAAGGPAGAVGGLFASELINSPKFLGGASKAAGNLSSRLSGASLPKGVENLLGQVSSRAPSLLGRSNQSPSLQESQLPNAAAVPGPTPFQQTPGQSPNTGGASSESISQEPFLSKGGQWRWDPQSNDWVPNKQPSSSGGVNKDNIVQAMLLDLAQNKGRNIPELKAILEVSQAAEGDNKPLPVEAQKQLNLAKSGLRGLDEVESILKEDPAVLFKNLAPGRIFSRKYDSALFRSVEALLRARSGAAVPEQEVRRYMGGIGISALDDPKTIKFKLDQLRMDFQDVLSGSQNSGSIEDFISGK